jgi:hypothetical protein
MSALLDFTNTLPFGRLTVIARAPNRGRYVMWRCQCTCGNTCVVLANCLRSGKTQSCGCYRKEITASRARVHGKTHTAEYAAWYGMRRRCENPIRTDFKHYGGRGIVVCHAWRTSFVQFFADVGPRPTPRHSLDRKDNNGHYSCGTCSECVQRNWPANYRWLEKIGQMNNIRTNRSFSFQGRTQTVSQWAREFHLPTSALWARLFTLNWSTLRALTTPLQKRSHRR